MDFWSRLIGAAYAPRKTTPAPSPNDPQARLHRFQKVYNNVFELCNRTRNPAADRPLFQKLTGHIEKIAALLREESRAPIPHTCLQYAASSQIYTVIARAAVVSQDEALIRSSIAVFAALIDSEEEGFLSSAPFAKSLMRLVTRLVDAGNVMDIATETTVLELVFTISANIRLQPEILPVWFRSTARREVRDVFVTEKQSFVGITAKDDFPLCYLLVDRVHHEGRIGDFARTGLLYIFEATGRSVELEEWIVSSDLPTLMATGLGALYSQLSRELSILHFDTNLPAVLAMSDYSTTSPRATAESAFSERHKAHMATFLSYLAFWQDILDHCRSSDVKQTLLDHFHILFLQQLLYPSLLQSSDTDAGSSVAVLTYMTAMVESLEYPELVHNMLTYLMAVQEPVHGSASTAPTPSKPPRSPQTLKRRESLLLLNAPKDPEHSVDPDLFNLVDLIINNVNSENSQSVFAAVRLVSAIVARQKEFAFGTLLKVQLVPTPAPTRTIGALQVELDRYADLATRLHQHFDLGATYQTLCGDVRLVLEAQLPTAPFLSSDRIDGDTVDNDEVRNHLISADDPLMRAIMRLLRSFFTNGVDVNLAVTQAIISIALRAEVSLIGWASLHPKGYSFAQPRGSARPWQSYLTDDEKDSWFAVQHASQRPIWPEVNSPTLYGVLAALIDHLDHVRTTIPHLEQLVADRKLMLQAYEQPDDAQSGPPSLATTPMKLTFHENSKRVSTKSMRDSDLAALDTRGSDNEATNKLAPTNLVRPPDATNGTAALSNASLRTNDVFRPPPPDLPSTTDVLMQTISFPDVGDGSIEEDDNHKAPVDGNARTASLNHVLTNIVVLQQFVLELTAVIQMRAVVLRDREVRIA